MEKFLFYFIYYQILYEEQRRNTNTVLGANNRRQFRCRRRDAFVVCYMKAGRIYIWREFLNLFAIQRFEYLFPPWFPALILEL